MGKEIKPGITGEVKIKVDDKETAVVYESGSVRVLATPALIRFMEKAALSSVAPCLDKGLTTVGTRVDVKHLAATPVGMDVVITSRLAEVAGKRLLFEVEARDQVDLIGTGIHERFIVKTDSFVSRTEAKLTK
ncbi:MAG: thioesterase family protein [Desulfotomaculaceae bacterium]|nr:thioesterase family protein [Desulfotomaculaceae bacterium]